MLGGDTVSGRSTQQSILFLALSADRLDSSPEVFQAATDAARVNLRDRSAGAQIFWATEV
ncbi:hypothetical protein EN792_021495 [Mesorhizobium sp. M00.F.Ca.ET.149.01.1.1]|uniref:hypothetical protein n=1 Tax=Mesorhizobium sp. M8A.F.Ca.ET.198.01.1.1 TaxID=2563966 RepID=UPI000FD7D0C0|nr:hypothetical protein [Mesorhizobium sp. M8A.F.Ca.ET.198.01.1.1]TGR47914.1 hypothetical protein EN841_20765 [Mesorhizobium sp. M8A.F.Ca.ET.198.01.1.1]TGV84282.1 hypothetical protein EN792_021495 [Mesorhizobium sp. M00.F.Ca.ET.149.01.1.1]